MSNWSGYFKPKRNTTSNLNNWQRIIEFGRLIVERTTNNKIRLKIGSGDRTYSQLNYIGEGVISKNLVLTEQVGTLSVGTNIKDMSFEEFIEAAYGQYKNVTLNSLNNNGPVLAIGQTFGPANITFTFSIGNIQNLLSSNSGEIISSPELFNLTKFEAQSGSFTILCNQHTRNNKGNVTFTLTVVGLNGERPNRTTTLRWLPYMVTGTSSLEAIPNNSSIPTGFVKELKENRQGTYTFNGGNRYSYFLIDDEISVGGITFRDADTNFEYPIIQLQSVTLNNGFTNRLFRQYRSVNKFNGITNCIVG